MNFAEIARTTAQTHAIRFLGHEIHTHDVPHVVYVVRGSARMTIDGRTICLEAGQAVWLGADVPHDAIPSPDGILLGPLLPAEASPPDGRCQVLEPMPALTGIMTTILCAAPEIDAERAPLQSALVEVLQTVTRDHFSLTLPVHPVARAIADQAAQFDGTLADLAAAHFTSVRHVQRLFLDETGLTFAQWRARARLNRAIAALRSGAGMREAMRQSGFATRHGLLKAIQRECDVSLADLLGTPEVQDEAA